MATTGSGDSEESSAGPQQAGHPFEPSSVTEPTVASSSLQDGASQQPSDDNTRFALEVLTAHNRCRKIHGVPPVTLDAQVNADEGGSDHKDKGGSRTIGGRMRGSWTIGGRMRAGG